MCRKPLAIAAVLGSVLAAGTAVAEDLCFKDKLTGGAAEIDSGGTVFSMSANAIQSKRKLNGHIQYSLDDELGEPLLYVHSKIECAGWAVNEDSGNLILVSAGPATVQHNPEALETDDWIVAGVEDVAIGSGDLVRVVFATEPEALAYCAEPTSLLEFPGVVLEGEFKIRIAAVCEEPPPNGNNGNHGNHGNNGNNGNNGRGVVN